MTNHVLSGAALGARMPNPVAAAAAGLVAHAVLDVVPHFGVDDAHLMKVAVPDGLVGLAAIGAVLASVPPGLRLRAAAGIAASCAPDLDKPGRQLLGRSPYPAWFDRLHAAVQRESPRLFAVEVLAGALFSVALAAAADPSRAVAQHARLHRAGRRRPGPDRRQGAARTRRETLRSLTAGPGRGR